MSEDDACPSCGCPTACPEARIEAARDYGVVVGALVGFLCSALAIFVVGMIAWLA